jgi:hypothetical protein
VNFAVLKSHPILLLGILLVISSYFLFYFFSNKKWLYLGTLLVGTAIVFFGAALLDPFIQLWDEQFHALVGKNLGLHPFKPTLYEITPLPYDYKIWTANHIWVHKPPMFLWQISLSIKVFGANELGVRFPSILLATLMVFFTYRIGCILKNERTGIIAAIFLSLNYFTWNLVSGYFHTDHNDVSFAFYVTASLWAYLEYREKGRNKFILLIGVFAGFAILTKWLTGLFVFGIWGLGILLDAKRRTNWKEYVKIFISFSICVMVFLPWQLYIYQAFPEESEHEFIEQTKHFNEVKEGHGGDFFYHIDQLQAILFNTEFISPILLVSIALFLRTNSKNRTENWSIIGMVFFAILFFSIAKTKMPAFTYFLTPLLLIIIASFIDYLFYKLNEYKIQIFQKLNLLISVFILFWFIDRGIRMNQLNSEHGESTENYYRIQRSEHASIYKKMNRDSSCIIFNVPKNEAPMVMFYTTAIAYEHVPDSATLIDLIQQGYQIEIFLSENISNEIRTIPDIKFLQKLNCIIEENG